MIDTIVYIPTILAYTFISLLVVILCFIVIYVSHKLYISIYDNLSIPGYIDSLHTAVVTGMDDSMTRMSKGVRMTTPRTNCCRKSKTALRIIVRLEVCYLAYVVFETEAIAWGIISYGNKEDSDSSTPLNDTVSHNILQHKKLVKYFDRLTDIPTEMQTCTPLSPANATMLSGVMNDLAKSSVSGNPKLGKF